MNQVQQCLIDAKALISDPARWCQGESGFDAHGHALRYPYILKTIPARMCGETACIRAGGLFLGAIEALDKTTKSPEKFHVWQDASERTHAEVMAAFDRAIELAGKP